MTTTLNFDASDPFVLLESTAYVAHSYHGLFVDRRLTTTAVYACALLAIKKVLNPVAPVYKYCLISVTNILTTTCQYEVWGTLIMQKKYKGFDYLEAFLVTLGCSVFILFSGRRRC
ncbi:PREDICTED: UDP-galactose/UDP-glucose transporter 5-like isoform X4 [Camelina sativa]|uniref:UDP-galactose/UDP-glucose transporter 5-like isoform X4 n=1 Tax=Camelina sativa TaxID=90675 RepID=A0ABM1Q6U2_CAMSA|nr:PREDICTED: UDP-galactose/UDP-glucose transporter 5-like isoform X4 [Camelina sativa]